MSRFNTPSVGTTTKTTNLAGGEAFSESPKLEFVSLLLTSFVKDQAYRSADQGIVRLKELINQIPDKKFLAKAAIYARTKFGMRSITHIVAAEIARTCSGQRWVKNFICDVIYRPDDALEILAYFDATYGKNQRANSLRKGIAAALKKFDAYSLAKYRGEGKKIKLVDIINFSHPNPEAKAEIFAQLMKGELKSTDTWESKLTQAGQNAENEEEKLELKGAAWKELITERKIKYFALLRNLRNIIQQAPDTLDAALTMLQEETLIKKSLVLPFRFQTAIQEIEKLDGPLARKTMVALNKAIDISCNNVPHFDGDTLVVLDGSGSMSGKPAEIGSLFSAILIKACNADFMTFGTGAKYVKTNPSDSTLTLAKNCRFDMGGTDFKAIFKTANRKYDRIIILSDMQGWIGYDCPTAEYKTYKNLYKADPKVYSFDLQGYGTLQFPERNVFCMAGFSDKVFDIMTMLEQDKNAMVSEIEKVKIDEV